MTIAILRENGDVLWFDAITKFDEQYTANVTRHPIATGGLISDHTIIDNTRFSFSGILSDADFNLNRPDLTRNATLQENLVTTAKQFVNNTQTNVPVAIESNRPPAYQRFLPETVAQYTRSKIPTVVMTPQPKAKEAVSVRRELIEMFEKKERFILLDLNTNLVNRQWDNCVMTSLSFNESPETGDALFPNINIERVQYVDIEKVQIKIRTPPNKGRKAGTTTSADTKPGDNAETGPTDLSKKADQQLKTPLATAVDAAST